jgi:hypothetical protein
MCNAKPRGAENRKATVYAFTLTGRPFAEFCAWRLASLAGNKCRSGGGMGHGHRENRTSKPIVPRLVRFRSNFFMH